MLNFMQMEKRFLQKPDLFLNIITFLGEISAGKILNQFQPQYKMLNVSFIFLSLIEILYQAIRNASFVIRLLI